MNAVALLLTASLVAGPVSAPQRVEVEPNWPGTVEVTGITSKSLVINLFEDKVQFRREYTDDATVMRFFAFGRTPGEYPIVFVIVDNGRPVEAARVVVVVKGGPIPPPIPPDPVPPPPVNDPLLERLKPIYGADVSANKQTNVKQLAAVYRQAVGTADNVSLTTLRQLYDVVRQAGQSVVPPPALDALRQVIAEEMTAKLGANNVPLDVAMRAKCKAEFARVAGVLEVLSK